MLIRKLRQLFGAEVRHVRIHPTALIAPSVILDRVFPQGIHIARGAIVKEGAVILAHDEVTGRTFNTRICADAIIGPRAVIMPGVVVGRKSVIMADVIVNEDVPDRAIVFGNASAVR